MDGSSVLVTGGTGFVGRRLCDVLNRLGARVHVVTRSGTAPTGCIPVRADLRDGGAVLAALNEVSPAYVFHLAATVDGRRTSELVKPTLESNLIGTVNVLAAVHAVGSAKVVMTGSSEEVSDPSEPPTSPYAASKAAARAYARMYHALYGLPVVIARPFMCYGPGQASSKVIPYTILSFLRGAAPVLTSGKRVCDFVYVDDVVRGLVMCALTAGLEGQTIDLGTGQPNTIHDVVDKLGSMLGARARIAFGGRPDRVLETEQVAFSSGGMRLAGWSPQWSLDEGLHETVEWYRKCVSKSSEMPAFGYRLSATEGPP
jgi:UDP-glucose 4-epimerase